VPKITTAAQRAKFIGGAGRISQCLLDHFWPTIDCYEGKSKTEKAACTALLPTIKLPLRQEQDRESSKHRPFAHD
jgi:hypothetical protein